MVELRVGLLVVGRVHQLQEVPVVDLLEVPVVVHPGVHLVLVELHVLEVLLEEEVLWVEELKNVLMCVKDEVRKIIKFSMNKRE